MSQSKWAALKNVQQESVPVYKHLVVATPQDEEAGKLKKAVANIHEREERRQTQLLKKKRKNDRFIFKQKLTSLGVVNDEKVMAEMLHKSEREL